MNMFLPVICHSLRYLLAKLCLHLMRLPTECNRLGGKVHVRGNITQSCTYCNVFTIDFVACGCQKS